MYPLNSVKCRHKIAIFKVLQDNFFQFWSIRAHCCCCFELFLFPSRFFYFSHKSIVFVKSNDKLLWWSLTSHVQKVTNTRSKCQGAKNNHILILKIQTFWWNRLALSILYTLLVLHTTQSWQLWTHHLFSGFLYHLLDLQMDRSQCV